MSDEFSGEPPPTAAISQEELARLLAASGMPGPAGPPNKNALRRKIIIAALIAAVGVGASAMSCVGQSFSYRQARALESIDRHLEAIQSKCAR
jgi:hypothetical protein